MLIIIAGLLVMSALGAAYRILYRAQDFDQATIGTDCIITDELVDRTIVGDNRCVSRQRPTPTRTRRGIGMKPRSPHLLSKAAASLVLVHC